MRYDLAFDNDLLQEGRTDLGPANANPVIDIGDSGAVRKFAREYLSGLKRPLEADALHDITAAISRYKGPPLVRRETLESFLATLLAQDHA